MATKTAVGTLNQRVTLQSKTEAGDGAGGLVPTWSTIAEVWAGVRAMTGRERDHAMRQEAQSNHVVTIRRRADVAEIDRVVWRGRNLNIRFVRDHGPREAFVELECDMGAAT